MTYDPATRRASPGTLEIVPLYIARQREDSGIVYRVVDAENEQAIQSLTTTEQAPPHRQSSASKTRHRRNEHEPQKNFGLRHAASAVARPGRWIKSPMCPGVTVGHATVRDARHHTGVTVIMPCEDNMFAKKLTAASFVLNGLAKRRGLCRWMSWARWKPRLR